MTEPPADQGGTVRRAGFSPFTIPYDVEALFSSHVPAIGLMSFCRLRGLGRGEEPGGRGKGCKVRLYSGSATNTIGWDVKAIFSSRVSVSDLFWLYLGDLV